MQLVITVLISRLFVHDSLSRGSEKSAGPGDVGYPLMKNLESHDKHGT